MIDNYSVVAETERTFMTIFLNASKCPKMIQSIRTSCMEGLLRSLKLPHALIDALLSIFPEMTLHRLSIGSRCSDSRDGRLFTILGSFN